MSQLEPTEPDRPTAGPAGVLAAADHVGCLGDVGFAAVGVSNGPPRILVDRVDAGLMSPNAIARRSRPTAEASTTTKHSSWPQTSRGSSHFLTRTGCGTPRRRRLLARRARHILLDAPTASRSTGAGRCDARLGVPIRARTSERRRAEKNEFGLQNGCKAGFRVPGPEPPRGESAGQCWCRRGDTNPKYTRSLGSVAYRGVSVLLLPRTLAPLPHSRGRLAERSRAAPPDGSRCAAHVPGLLPASLPESLPNSEDAPSYSRHHPRDRHAQTKRMTEIVPKARQ